MEELGLNGFPAARELDPDNGFFPSGCRWIALFRLRKIFLFCVNQTLSLLLKHMIHKLVGAQLCKIDFQEF